MTRDELVDKLADPTWSEEVRRQATALVAEYDRARHQEVVARARDILGECAVDRIVDDVAEFMARCDQVEHIREKPGVPNIHTVSLAQKLIREEGLNELLKALLASEVYTQGPLPNEDGSDGDEYDEDYRQVVDDVADGIADTIFVCVWTALAFGVSLRRVWVEVAKKNLEKAGGPKDPATGKQLKPEGWTPPDIRRAVWGE